MLQRSYQADVTSQTIQRRLIKLHRSLHPRSKESYANTPRTFSPIPKRVMNGSEEGDVLPAAVLSGAPIELEARTVR